MQIKRRGHLVQPNTRMTQNQRMSRAIWAQRLGVSEKQLEEAIEQTSENDPSAVRLYLVNHKYISS